MGRKKTAEEPDWPECYCCRFLDSPLSELNCNKLRSVAIPLKNMINIKTEDDVCFLVTSYCDYILNKLFLFN